MADKAMTYDEAIAYVKANPLKATVYPPWFGKGWSVGFDGRILVDINPHTGTLLVHKENDPRNQCEWFTGTQPKDS